MVDSLRVLIADDEKNIRLLLGDLLRKNGFDVDTAENGDVALRKLESGSYDILLTDLKMPYFTGMDIIRKLNDQESAPVILMMTAFSSVETAVEAMKLGAFDFIVKPVDTDQLIAAMEKAAALTSQRKPAGPVKKIKRSNGNLLIGNHPLMEHLKSSISKVAPLDMTVLIQGETGTGKELIAKEIHAQSKRSNGPFIAVNCAAFNENLIESEFFGHEKGAFTGATEKRMGRFELADGGTLFLDEIGDLPQPVQAKLLRVLQERTLERVGGMQSITVNVRLITATCQDLFKKVSSGTFREDLFYRLAVFPIQSPPLRDRSGDIPLLIDHIVAKLAGQLDLPVPQIENDFYSLMQQYAWPGNVRELENYLQRLLVLVSAPAVWTGAMAPASQQIPVGKFSATQNQGDTEIQKLLETLQRTGCNISLAAEKLGISRVTLYSKIKHYQIDMKEVKAGL